MNKSDTADMVPASPAATLVLFRDRIGDAPEILMVERSSKMAFAAGAIVFPGGKVDADDHLIAARHSGYDLECAAARVAAIRETIEESGVPIGLAETPHAGWLEHARTSLHARLPFSALLDGANLTLDLDTLIPFARWRPNFRETRVFDTRFYIARAPDDLPDAVVDATENVRTFWDSAQATLDAADRGDVHVIFPTRRNLERLALFADYESARDHSLTTPVQMVTPWIEDRDGVRHLCIGDTHGYPITAESFETAKRAGD